MKKPESNITINILHLEDGVHEFRFTSEPETFKVEENNLFTEPVNIEITLQKFEQNYLVDFQVITQGHFTCDRCLEEFVEAIKNTERITFTLNPHLGESASGDLRAINPQTMEIDLTEDIRELLWLALPSKNLCSKNCKGLCAGCGANLNQENCTCKKESIDSRWEALKKLAN